MAKNFNEVLKNRELEQENFQNKEISLDSTERVKVLSPGQLVFKRFINNKLAIVGAVILIAMFTFSFIIPLFYPYSQTQIFYKYDDSVIDYALATQKGEYTLMYFDGVEDIHYTAKNYLTTMINSILASSENEGVITDENGNSYVLKEDTPNVFSLYASELSRIASLSDSYKYASYNMVSKEIVYEANMTGLEGFEEALVKAVEDKADAFTVGGEAFTLTKDKKTYVASMESGKIMYSSDMVFGSDFEELFKANIDGGSFECNGFEFVVIKSSEGSSVYRVRGQSKIAILSNLVFDSTSADFKITDKLTFEAVNAISEGRDFSFDGVDYVIKESDGELGVYKKDDSSTPAAVISTHVIRRYNGEDSLDFDFKERVREVINDMEASGLKESSFTWNIAEVDENGLYTYDDNGEVIKEERNIKVVKKNGSFVLSVEHNVYLIDVFARPSKEHIVGTDGDGMDVFARMMYGGRVSLIFSFVVIIIETILGIVLGGISGYFGGWIDTLIMRLVDIFYCIPHLPILIILGAMFDAMRLKPYVRIAWLMIVLGVLGWASVARMVRGQILSLREQEFMVATEAVGLKTGKRIFKHLIPNVMPQLIVTATSGLGDVIITESTLSFLGLGVKHPLATWGTMINSVSTAEAMKAYTYIWVPVGLLICLTVVAFNFVGDGLRDAFDPKMKR